MTSDNTVNNESIGQTETTSVTTIPAIAGEPTEGERNQLRQAIENTGGECQ